MDNTYELIELLRECKIQFKYLNEKFKETGTTNAMLARIDRVINEYETANGLNLPDVTLRPDWLFVFEEMDILTTFNKVSKLQAVKDLFHIARERGVDETFGLKWCKKYIEFNSK